jgi:HTH-type transcriptional regulator/antitoxin MqsA
MKCPACGAADLVGDVQCFSYHRKGETTEILDVAGEFCRSCGEAILSSSESQRVSAAMREFNNQIDTGPQAR